jgi:hypothetical protein
MLLMIIRPDARPCDRCPATGGGLLLEDAAKVRKVFCLACFSAVLAALLPRRSGGEAAPSYDRYDLDLIAVWEAEGNLPPPSEEIAA